MNRSDHGGNKKISSEGSFQSEKDIDQEEENEKTDDDENDSGDDLPFYTTQKDESEEDEDLNGENDSEQEPFEYPERETEVEAAEVQLSDEFNNKEKANSDSEGANGQRHFKDTASNQLQGVQLQYNNIIDGIVQNLQSRLAEIFES